MTDGLQLVLLCTNNINCLPSTSLSVGGDPQDGTGEGVGTGSTGKARQEGGYGLMGGVERLHNTQLQQQIMVVLGRLQEDLRSVMDRLEVVERLAATNVSVYKKNS